MQQHDEFTNGQTIKMNASSDELASSASAVIKDKTQLSRVSWINLLGIKSF
jgi:hypothetical protein